MRAIKITQGIYELNQKRAYYIKPDEIAFMCLVDNRPMIYVKDAVGYWLYASDKELREILDDDVFTEAIIYYLINEKNADHITDVLHWYASDRDLTYLPFTLYDMIHCDYDL